MEIFNILVLLNSVWGELYVHIHVLWWCSILTQGPIGVVTAV